MMRILLIGTALAALTACGERAATNTADAAAANAIVLADNGAVEDAGNAAAPAVAGGATATLRTADGKDVGTVRAREADGALTFTVYARAMPAGAKGIHVHAVGKCEAPGFTSAGPHWNPTARKHGKDNPAGPHLGDLPNLDVGAGGTGTVTFTAPNAALRTGANALLDTDGAAFVVHAKADDYRTDPSGESGDRIACGTFTAG